MAVHKGSEGLVKVGSATVAELKSYSYEQTSSTIETTPLTGDSTTFLAGKQSWSGTLSCFWDETDTTGQVALANGASVTLNFYPEGAASGDTFDSGTAIVNSLAISAETDGIVEVSFGFQGTGDITRATV